MRRLRQFGLLAITLMVGLGLVGLAPSRAQDTGITISLAVPSFTDSIFTDRLINTFETAHPGVKVSVLQVDANVPPAAPGLDQHLQGLQRYTSAADVLYVASSAYNSSSNAISEEATRGGYYLDMKPLVDEDKSLNPADFYTPIWQSFQWDHGVWALPISADPYLLTYSPAAFDAAKLAYPSEKWTADDLANAIRQLSVKNSSGKVTTPGVDVFGAQLPVLFRSLLTSSYIDTGSVPNAPKFDTPEIASLLQTWLKLDQDGMIGAELNKAPMSVSPAVLLAFPASSADKRSGALLPGGKATLDVQGFAVSAGTQYPQQAYALAAWLTTRAEVATYGQGTVPARKSLVGSQPGSTQAFTVNIPPVVQTLIDQAVANAIPLSEMRFADYLGDAYNKMKTANADVHVALQGAEDAAVKQSQAAAAGKNKLALVVATPVPPLALPAGKIALKFGVVNFQIPNQDAWNKLIGDFTASDPQVAKVLLDKYLGTVDFLGQALSKFDCVYAPFNGVTADRLPKLLNLDPFLTADPNFDKTDMVGGALAQVTMDNKTWMLPSDVEPVVLKYDSDRFSKDGIPLPGAAGTPWTTQQFADALKALKADSTGKPGFIPANTFGTYVLQLIAAYGGNPIDYRTNPPTLNFTDTATQDAIQELVNLAKNGDFTYHPLFGQQLDIVLLPDPS
ncbi:MAG TPA: extracellular solute-binding protein, partial [Aggregatilineales bacterium]|nr:extracellular solute-binding protein [Aggregatilineales bacterium]